MGLHGRSAPAVLEAFAGMPDKRLLIAGTGPEGARLRAASAGNVRFLGAVADDELRWLYGNCAGVVTASYEDFGMTPLEAAAFGKPAAVLRFGGFLDSVVEDVTGVFFAVPSPEAIRAAVRRVLARRWDEAALVERAAEFSEARFVERLIAQVERCAGASGAVAPLVTGGSP